MTHVTFVLREATAADHNYILSSFLTSYYQFSPCKFAAGALYYQQQGEIIKFLLGSCQVQVACFPEDPTEIAGYIMYQYIDNNLIIHYVYVREPYRKQKLAQDMIMSLINDVDLIVATHYPYNFVSLKHMIPNKSITYDPFFITNQRLIHDRT